MGTDVASARVLVVDDHPANIRLLEAILVPRGYDVVPADSGEAALKILDQEPVDIVLLDVVMPGLDGYEVCREMRSREDTAYLPVVMVTASGEQQRIRALEAGADDFLTKPVDRSELLARVASLTRIKRYHDTIRRQAKELAAWNRELEDRVQAQVSQLERLGELRRFLSPQLADVIVRSDENLLRSHRREIVVVMADFRGFTPFAEISEPEEVMAVLNEFHTALGELVFRYEGTLERFAGDGVMVFFNDPVPCADAPRRALEMSLDLRDRVRVLAEGWQRLGHDLALGIGVAQGYATLGRIGFHGRFDYAAIGSVTNLAARLCDGAGRWEVLTSERVLAGAGEGLHADEAGVRELKGFTRPVRTFNVTHLERDETTR
jgi:adenylate cyclase